MAFETSIRQYPGQVNAIKELQGQSFRFAAGAAAGQNISVPGIKTEDTVVAVLNFTDLANVSSAAVKASRAAGAGFNTVLEAHLAGLAGNDLKFSLVGDSAQPVKASFGPGWAGAFDSVLEAHVAGAVNNDYKIVMVGDSGAAAGVTVNVNTGTKTVTIHYESGVSTIGHVNTAITALAGGNDVVDVKTAGTSATVLTAPGDNFGVTNLAGGVDGGGVTVSIDHPLVEVHYQSGVSTVALVEAAITALAGADDLIDVKTAGTGANILTSPASDLDEASLIGGLDAVTAELPTIPADDVIQLARTSTAGKTLLVVYYPKPL